MGLDMYLYRTTYVSSYDEKGKPLRRKLLKLVNAEKVADDSGLIFVKVTVAYWRKANQIHKWFVDHCQGGVDDCREAEVGRKQLIELRDLCKSLLKRKNVNEAEKKLPTQDGFFFGNTSVDEYYWDDIELTVKQLDRVLEQTPEGSRAWFEYRSSW